MNYLLHSSYFKGVRSAHNKLGTVAGPIPYAPTSDPNPFDPAQENRMQREFKGLDEHSNFSEATKSADYIRGDLDRTKPQRADIQRSTIDQAFTTNNTIGEEFGLGDPASTQPNGSDKVAFSNPLAGGSSPINGSMMGIPGVKPLSQLTPPMPKMTSPGAGIKNQLTTDAHNMLGQNSMLSRAARGNGNPF